MAQLSEWQRQVLVDLRAIADAFPDEVQVLGRHRLDKVGAMHLRLRLRTADILRADGGLPVGPHEEVVVTVDRLDLLPPRVKVDHLRFLHHAHVLEGQRLCIYLDPSREWDPGAGFAGFIDRLFGWFGDAAAGRFDAQTALYHAVGGVLHSIHGAPTIVVREGLEGSGRARHGWLVARTPHRFDLSFESPIEAGEMDHVPVVTLDVDLPFGAGGRLKSFFQIVDDPYLGHPPPGGPYLRDGGRRPTQRLSGVMLTVLGASAIRKVDGTPQRFVVAVPHPTGGPPHLLAANIPAKGADHIRALVRSAKNRSSIIDIDPVRLDPTTPLEWWPVCDERTEVTTRRDAGRPVVGYSGKTVHIWGCGGIGSWVAECVVRAGAKKVVLCDPGTVTGGLLVRQNFVEADVGRPKVEALAQRLQAISDTVEITVHDAVMPAEDLRHADLVIDATVSVAISRLLDDFARAHEDRPLLAHVATDAGTGTLGVLTVSTPPLRVGPLTIDRKAGEQVSHDGSLEAFQTLWDSTAQTEQIIPTRGCSTPTFHGSAADLTGVAASLTSILGAHLGGSDTLSGTHLISLPHGEAGPLRVFLPAPASIDVELNSVHGAA
jgi:molybdopterin/thiamine biosynthesis adenylyltransferase